MLETISYRIPGSEPVCLKGAFRKIDALENFEGFCISDFLGDQILGFVEGKSIGTSQKTWNVLPKVINHSEYINQAETFIEELKVNQINKAILSRIKEVRQDGFEQQRSFERLCDTYPETFVYSIQSAAVGNWFGASPEKLIKFKDNIGQTVALAATKSKEDDSPWDQKETEEQLIVRNFIRETLDRFAVTVDESEVFETIAGPIKHLTNAFQFTIDQKNLVDLLKDLHPTPAVCGLPKQKALGLIQKIEEHNRGWYTGMVGVKTKSELDLYVNLRCAQAIEDKVYLYLGGGFTQDSIPEKEWEETEKKSRTLMNIF